MERGIIRKDIGIFSPSPNRRGGLRITTGE